MGDLVAPPDSAPTLSARKASACVLSSSKGKKRMPLLNFKPRFVEPIRMDTKRHTIRAERKIPIKVGDNLYLYCGARTKKCFRILPEPVPCTKVQTITIEIKTRPDYQLICVVIDGEILDSSEAERLAFADGFSDFKDMMKFWEGRLPFKGQIIHWRPLPV
jgi:hypothetical protein